MDHKALIESLINKARFLLTVEAEQFVPQTADYLQAFDAWTNLNFSPPEEEHAAYRTLIVQLQGLHTEVTALANNRKDEVAAEMAELNKRGAALRKYIDRYPSKITIAGTRKG